MKMTHSRTIYVFGLAVLVSLALTSLSCYAATKQDSTLVSSTQQSSHSSLASKLLPHSKARTSRSLSDMFEKVKSKIFGSRKQATSTSSQNSAVASSQIQPSASVNMAQRAPWGDLNSFNQQFSPYSNFQWPSSSSGNQFQQYNPLGANFPSTSGQSAGSSAFSSFMNPSGQAGIPNFDGSQQQGLGSALSGPANSNSVSNPANAAGGLLSSASQLIAQYLSPGAGSSASGVQSGAQQVANAGQQNLMSPQQQQQSQQYNEFASILDSMVAQTGATSQRQPSMSQYLNQQGIQQQNYQSGVQPSAGNMMSADNEMSGSSNIQSYLPAGSGSSVGASVGSQPAASQKSSMVNLAEQLAPGANFNKLVSFPFSLSNNDDPNKEGRYKLHIPFLNQHVKRSDQQQQQQQQQVSSSSSAANQQQQQQQQRIAQQYLTSYYNQFLAGNPSSQQMLAQSSMAVPTVVSPQSSSIAQSPASSSASSSSQPQSNSISQSSSSSVPSSSSSSSSASAVSSPQSSMLSSPNSPSVSSSAISGSQQSQLNSRPSWSVADIQSSASSSKLIPMPSAVSLDSAISSQS